MRLFVISWRCSPPVKKTSGVILGSTIIGEETEIQKIRTELLTKLKKVTRNSGLVTT